MEQQVNKQRTRNMGKLAASLISLSIFSTFLLMGCGINMYNTKLGVAGPTAAEVKKNTPKHIVNPFYPRPLTVDEETNNNFRVQLDVPLISQLPELPTGCEITAVTMLLEYKGVDIDKTTLADEMPRNAFDPNVGYVGDPYSDSGWTIYPSALTDLVTEYAGSAKNLTGVGDKKLEKQLLNNKPVVVWVSPMHGFKVHALVLTGFDKDNFYYNDCWTGQMKVKISKNKFNRIWGNQNKMAITY